MARVHAAFPDLTLVMRESLAAPQGMAMVHSLLNRPQMEPWPVDWLVTGTPDQPRLADLRILGVSLGIFLRSVATLQGAPSGAGGRSAAAILEPWRQALERALPQHPGSPPR